MVLGGPYTNIYCISYIYICFLLPISFVQNCPKVFVSSPYRLFTMDVPTSRLALVVSHDLSYNHTITGILIHDCFTTIMLSNASFLFYFETDSPCLRIVKNCLRIVTFKNCKGHLVRCTHKEKGFFFPFLHNMCVFRNQVRLLLRKLV